MIRSQNQRNTDYIDPTQQKGKSMKIENEISPAELAELESETKLDLSYKLTKHYMYKEFTHHAVTSLEAIAEDVCDYPKVLRKFDIRNRSLDSGTGYFQEIRENLVKSGKNKFPRNFALDGEFCPGYGDVKRHEAELYDAIARYLYVLAYGCENFRLSSWFSEGNWDRMIEEAQQRYSALKSTSYYFGNAPEEIKRPCEAMICLQSCGADLYEVQLFDSTGEMYTSYAPVDGLEAAIDLVREGIVESKRPLFAPE
jgi:hypothetical protein